MGKVSDYAFINAKLRARIGIIRTETVIDDMIKAPTLSEAVAKLDGTRFSALAEIYRATGDLQQVELALVSNEIASYREVASYLEDRGKAFINVLLEKVEIDNLKNALRIWYSSAIRGHQINSRSPYIEKRLIVHPIDYDKILNASSFSQVVHSLQGTPYHDVARQFADKDFSSMGLFPLEIALDHLWFDQLGKAEAALSSEDRKIASAIFSTDVDLKNILFIVRYRFYYNIGAETLDRILLPYGTIGKEAKKLGTMSDDEMMARLKRIVSYRYPEIVQEIESIRAMADDLTRQQENAMQILKIENYLARTREKEYSRLLFGNPFSIGVVLAYFFISRQQDSLIQAVLSAKYYNWEEGRIREALHI